jgi:hypothetical protein
MEKTMTTYPPASGAAGAAQKTLVDMFLFNMWLWRKGLSRSPLVVNKFPFIANGKFVHQTPAVTF